MWCSDVPYDAVFRCAVRCGAIQTANVTYRGRNCHCSEPVSLGRDACGGQQFYLWRLHPWPSARGHRCALCRCVRNFASNLYYFFCVWWFFSHDYHLRKVKMKFVFPTSFFLATQREGRHAICIWYFVFPSVDSYGGFLDMSGIEIVAGKHRASLRVTYSGEQRVRVAAAVLHSSFKNDSGYKCK